MKLSLISIACPLLLAFVCGSANAGSLRKKGRGDHRIDATFKIGLPGVADKEPDRRDIEVAQDALMRAYNKVMKNTKFEMVDAQVESVGPGDEEGHRLAGRRWTDWIMFTSISCNLCGPDDDQLGWEASPLDYSGALKKLKDVEKLYCKILSKDSKDKYFEKTHDCSFTKDEDADRISNAKLEEADAPGPNYIIEDWLNLSLPGLPAAPQAEDFEAVPVLLMGAYNQVYEGTDFKMIDAQVDTVDPYATEEHRLEGWNIRVSFGCNLCGAEDGQLVGESPFDYSGAFDELKQVAKLVCNDLNKGSNDEYVHLCSLTHPEVEEIGEAMA